MVSVTRWLKRLAGSTPRTGGRRSPGGPRLEQLEDRVTPAGFVFIDYGDNFPLSGGNRTLNTTIQGLRDIADSPNPNDKILGSVIGDSAGFAPVFNGQVTINAGARTITRAAGNFVNDGFRANHQITISNTASNNGNFVIQSVTNTVLTLTAAGTLTNETANTARIGPRLDTPITATRPNFTAAERAQIRAVVTRAYRPLDLTVVELTPTVQNLADGRAVAAATSLNDVVNTLRGGNATFRDAYVIVANFVVSPGGPNQNVYSNGGGISPDSPTLGVASDLATGANNHDDVALVFAFGMGGNFSNTMNNISHEAGHLLGMQHSITDTGINATTLQLHQAEIMSYQNTNNTSSSMFTRYPMVRGDDNTPTFSGRVVFNAAARTLTSNSGNFPTQFAAGQQIQVTGTASNNGTYTVQTLAGNVITLVAGTTLTNETANNTFIRLPNPFNYNDLGPRNTPAGRPTYHDQLAQDANVRANQGLTFVSGTGAHDIITIARSGAQATVTVQAFSTANYTTGITVPGSAPASTTFQYTIPLTQPILVYGGDGADRFVIDADLGVQVEVDGMLGTDALVLNGKNAATATYTPAATSPLGVDVVPSAISGMINVVSFEGTLTTSGGTTIVFRDFETAGSVTVQNVTSVTLTTPNSADNLQLTSPAGTQGRVSGTSGGIGLVPLSISGVANFVVDTATNDGAGGGTGSDAVSVNLTAGPTTSLVVNTGAGTDNVTVVNLGAGFGIPLEVNADGGIDTLEVQNTTATYTPDASNQPDRGTLSAYGGRSIAFTDFEYVTPVAPVITSYTLDQAEINENGSVTVSVSFLDPGSLSSYTIDIVWSDGPSDSFSPPVGTRSFTRTHQYRDDGDSPGNNTPQDVVPIQVTITDNDNLADDDTRQLTVKNVAPDVANLAATTIDENDETTLTGTITDAGTLDEHDVVIDWDDPNNAADSTFHVLATSLLAVNDTFASSTDSAELVITAVSLDGLTATFQVRHRYLDDGPAPGNNTVQDTSTIQVGVADDDTGTDGGSASVLVRNVAPVITAHDNSASSDEKVEEGDTVTVFGAFTDVGTLDRHTVTLDWGDGNVTSGTVNQVARTFEGQHAYSAGGIYTVTITLSDDDTLVATAIETIFVTGAGIQTIGGKQVLFVVGSNDPDQVVINQLGSGAVRVHATFLNDPGQQRTFAQPVDEIRVVLCAGDDRSTIAGSVAIPALIDGGKGNDRLNAGGTGGVVTGGPGDDMLIGSNGRDILIGGDGADRLVGNGGEDILIGGLTAFTDGPDDAILANQISLLKILDEWNSSRSAASRRDNIGGVATNPEFSDRLNGNNYLKLNDTVTDDGDADVITGGAGGNWFFVYGNDILTDFKAKQGDVKAT